MNLIVPAAGAHPHCVVQVGQTINQTNKTTAPKESGLLKDNEKTDGGCGEERRDMAGKGGSGSAVKFSATPLSWTTCSSQTMEVTLYDRASWDSEYRRPQSLKPMVLQD